MKRHRGIHANRLREACNNPREFAFAKQWEAEQTYKILECLFEVPATKDTPSATRVFSRAMANPDQWICLPLGDSPSDRDCRLAATLMQWLGSNVGMAFLQDALKRCGYKIEKSDSPRPGNRP